MSSNRHQPTHRHEGPPQAALLPFKGSYEPSIGADPILRLLHRPDLVPNARDLRFDVLDERLGLIGRHPDTDEAKQRRFEQDVQCAWLATGSGSGLETSAGVDEDRSITWAALARKIRMRLAKAMYRVADVLNGGSA